MLIDLAGELTSSAETALLNAYQQASSNGARLVILNLRQLEYKNSSAITLLVALPARCNSAVQHLSAVELSAEYRKIFHVTQLEQGIRLHDNDWIFGNIAFGTS
jgi:anti-anti-sigma factor